MCEIVKERFQQEESGAERKENEYKYIMRKIQSAALFQYLSFLPSCVVDERLNGKKLSEVSTVLPWIST